jgi:hypothetical protein
LRGELIASVMKKKKKRYAGLVGQVQEGHGLVCNPSPRKLRERLLGASVVMTAFVASRRAYFPAVSPYSFRACLHSTAVLVRQAWILRVICSFPLWVVDSLL